MGKGNRSISVEVWADARAWRELGESFGVIHRRLSKKYGKTKIPAEKSITIRAAHEGWIAGKAIEEAQATIAGRNLETYARHGLTDDTVAEAMARGVSLSAAAMDRFEKAMVKATEKDVSPETIGFLRAAMAELTGDLNTAYKYVTEFNKCTGKLAPTKLETSGTLNVNTQLRSLDDASLRKEVMRLVKHFLRAESAALRRQKGFISK